MNLIDYCCGLNVFFRNSYDEILTLKDEEVWSLGYNLVMRAPLSGMSEWLIQEVPES